MIQDKYVGLLLAITSSLAIGTSYVITKKGLQHASEQHGFDGAGHQYLKSPIWWGGIVTLALGEFANFAAYAFAPAVLVTPLGALSVLTGAVLGAYFLKEQLGRLGWLGCFICVIGSVIIASHAPPDEEIQTVDEILDRAINPGNSFNRMIAGQETFTNSNGRFLGLLCFRGSFFQCHDLQNSPKIWEIEPPLLPLDLRHCRIGLCHVNKSIWHCSQIDLERQQSIYASFDLCLCDRGGRLRSHTNELFQ